MVEEVNGIHFEAKEEGDAENMRQRLPAIHDPTAEALKKSEIFR